VELGDPDWPPMLDVHAGQWPRQLVNGYARLYAPTRNGLDNVDQITAVGYATVPPLSNPHWRDI